MILTTTLVCVVNGAAYENFAADLFESALTCFRPTKKVDFLMLPVRPGWPEATMYRYHSLANFMPNSNYVFLSDADMIFESLVGDEILPTHGVAATLHPGYVTVNPDELPYERNPDSATYVLPHQKESYYCGGFVGGTRQHMLNMARDIASMIDTDRGNGITPVWHDESALNKYLSRKPPQIKLTPAYCHPDNDTYYKTIWPEEYPRKLVALDKDSNTRGER